MKPLIMLSLFTVGALLSSTLNCVSAQTEVKTKQVVSSNPSDYLNALPSSEQLNSFDTYDVSKYKDSVAVAARRIEDGLTIYISIGVTSDETQAKTVCKSVISTSSAPGGMAVGSWSGRKIGQENWRPIYPSHIVQPEGAYTLLSRDGRSVIQIHLMFTPASSQEHPFDKEDLLLVEDQAIACFDRLTKLGYTSRSISKAPAKGIKSSKAVKPAHNDKGTGGKS